MTRSKEVILNGGNKLVDFVDFDFLGLTTMAFDKVMVLKYLDKVINQTSENEKIRWSLYAASCELGICPQYYNCFFFRI